jgi:hypothetical protein
MSEGCPRETTLAYRPFRSLCQSPVAQFSNLRCTLLTAVDCALKAKVAVYSELPTPYILIIALLRFTRL